jgi:AraC-like DNA-binding protein
MSMIDVATDVDLPSLEAPEREAYWQVAVRDRLAPMAVRVIPDRPSIAGAIHSRHVGDLLFTDWDCPRMEGVRSRSKLRETEQDAVVIFAGYRGSEHLSFGGIDATLEADTLLVASGRAGGRFWVPDRVGKRTLVLPRVALEAADAGPEIPYCLLLDRHRPLVRLFHSFLEQVWRQLPGMNAADTEAARTALVALSAGAIRSQAGSVTDRSALPALRAQFDKWIGRNLRNGPIRVEDLAAAHNVSARTVHRAFSITGDTMTAVVRARRLAAVREDIVRTNLTMAAIAHRCGYYDPSHLGREFRRYFGASPGEYRQAYGY